MIRGEWVGAEDVMTPIFIAGTGKDNINDALVEYRGNRSLQSDMASENADTFAALTGALYRAHIGLTL
jgi:hypothetical protein